MLDHAAAVGAGAVLISDSLGPAFAGRVRVTLTAVPTSTRATGESLPAQVLTDALVLGVRAKDEARATERAELLTALRSELSQTGHPRRPRTPSPHRKESP